MKLMSKLLFSVSACVGLLIGTKTFAAALNDGQIAQIIKTANDAEIDAAKYTESKTKNKDVKKFAKMMQKEHSENNHEAKKVEKKENIAPIDSDASTEVKTDADAKLAELKAADAKTLDSVYVSQQIAMHQKLLTDIDQTLLPAAQNVELKTLLNNTRSHVQAHLEHAQQLQSKLK